jgi:hypothetical protein
MISELTDDPCRDDPGHDDLCRDDLCRDDDDRRVDFQKMVRGEHHAVQVLLSFPLTGFPPYQLRRQ